MITPNDFPGIEDFIVAANMLKLDKYVAIVLTEDEEGANEFLKMWRDRPGVDVGGAES
jgi:hypothetical protein